MRKPRHLSRLAIAAFAVAALALPASAMAAPQWIDGNTSFGYGTSCPPFGSPTYETQVGGFTGYWGETDTSYPKIGDRFWGHVHYTVTGLGCGLGIQDVKTEIALPQGTQLAINPSSQDPNDKIQCWRTNRDGSVVNVTDVGWTHPGNGSITGKHCESTKTYTGANGTTLAYTLLAQGQSMHIVFPLVATKKLSGIAEPNNASRMTATLSGSNITSDAKPYQWNFVGDRPVDASCSTLGQQTTTSITNTTAHSKGFLCNWYRTGKAQFEIREGTAGTFVPQASSPEYTVEGQFQGYLMDQDWNNLKPGTDYQWRLKFTDTKGTATTADDTLHYGTPVTFKTTGTPPAPGTGGPPTPGTGGTGGTGGMTPGTEQPGDTGDTGTGDQPPAGQAPGADPPADQQQPPDLTPARDTQPPSLTAAIGKARLAQVLKKGLTVTATCSESCTVKAELQLDAKTAKKLKLGKKAIAIGKGTSVGSGKVTVPVKLTAKARKALKRTRSLKATVVVTAIDASGNAAKPARRKVTLKR